MSNILGWLKNNAVWLIPTLVVVLTNIANGLTDHPKVKGVLLGISKIIDQFPTTILAKKSAPGQTLKLPLMASRWPEGHPLNPDNVPTIPAPPKLPTAAIILFFFALSPALMGAHCTAQQVEQGAVAIAKSCGSTLLPAAEAEIPSAMSALLAGGTVWTAEQQKLEGLGISAGIDLAACIVEEAVYYIEQSLTPPGPTGAAYSPTDARVQAIKRGTDYLTKRAKQDGGINDGGGK